MKSLTLKAIQILFAILSLSAIVCKAGASGSYTVIHKGAYVAHVRITFLLNGEWQTYETDNYTSGMRRTIELPVGATRNRILVKNAVFIATWRTVFEMEWETPQRLCFEIWGTTFHPSWESYPC